MLNYSRGTTKLRALETKITGTKCDQVNVFHSAKVNNHNTSIHHLLPPAQNIKYILLDSIVCSPIKIRDHAQHDNHVF
jgi:hypothetical protein